MKHISIQLTDYDGSIKYDAVHGIQGDKESCFQDTLDAFENYLAAIHGIDPTEQALDLVSAVEL